MTETLVWIVIAGLVRSGLALIGGLGLMLEERTLRRVILPLVALAAGSLLGGAVFHLLPESVEALGNGTGVWLWASLGFVAFFGFEQFLHYHHCHGTSHDHRHPLGHMVLVADTLHNLVGGLAVAAAFVVDLRVGAMAFVAMASHEVPQELGDFGALVHAGWSRGAALLFNWLSSLAFLTGGLVAYLVSRDLDLTFLVPFAAGSFIYVAAADLVPEINRHEDWRVNVVHFAAFGSGLALLLLVRLAVVGNP
ncbi:MAG: ZIP family metal transporter [Thermoanaerobaculia bacterium]|nr:ZIP family metal transporter [Thermoanaerobaculia bacterium]